MQTPNQIDMHCKILLLINVIKLVNKFPKKKKFTSTKIVYSID
jgi:hypothetical protein